MELFWNVLYLVAALGGGFACAIIASNKGYRDMLWFLAAFFPALLHPILLILPLGVVIALKDLNKLGFVIEKEKLALERDALEKGHNKEQLLDEKILAGFKKRLRNTEKLGNWIGFLLAIGPGVVLFFGRGL